MKRHTEESRKKISESMLGEKHYFYGVKRPEHSNFMKNYWKEMDEEKLNNIKEKISNYYKNNSKIILQMNKDNDNIIMEGTIRDFIEKGFNKNSIYHCCRNNSKTSQGFKWKYKN